MKTRLLRLPRKGVFRIPEFFLDGTLGFGRDFDELHAYAHTRQAVADLGPGVYLEARAGQAESDFEHCALRKMTGSLDEHSPRTEVWRAERDLLAVTLVTDPQFAEMGIMALVLP